MRRATMLPGWGAMVCMIFLGCNAEKKPAAGANPTTAAAPTGLNGTNWRLEDLAGTPAIANSPATIGFAEPGRVAGNSSCNRFTGAAEISGNSIKFGAMVTTRMMCDPAANEQETKFLKALEGVQRYEVKDGKLYMYSSGPNQPLRFAAAGPMTNQ